MNTPRAVDLFGGEGGSACGLARAGFDVTAVDDVDRPGRCPDVRWVTADATTFSLDGFDVVLASPPCTDRSTLRNVAEPIRGGPAGTGWMLSHTVDRLRTWAAEDSGRIWVVENVEGARRDLPGALTLCGSMFGLEDEGWLLRRHRLFLSNVELRAPKPCDCRGRPTMSINGDLRPSDRATEPTGVPVDGATCELP